MKAGVIITTDGKFKSFPPHNGKKYTLKELQDVVGGYIEVIRTPMGRLMIIDEEGKLKEKPVNVMASDILVGILQKNDVIVGDVVYCEPDALE